MIIPFAPIELTTLSRERTPIEWPREWLAKGKMPSATINGAPTIILERSTHRICEPPQIWLTLMDEKSGTTYQVALEDDYISRVVSVRLMAGPY